MPRSQSYDNELSWRLHCQAVEFERLKISHQISQKNDQLANFWKQMQLADTFTHIDPLNCDVSNFRLGIDALARQVDRRIPWPSVLSWSVSVQWFSKTGML